MKRAILGSIVASLILLGGSPVQAQRATEIFIPIGQSAGLSGKHTLMARVSSVDAAQRSVTLMDGEKAQTMRITDQTQLWLDRSKSQQPNRKATLADVRPDMMAEVKYRNNDRAAGVVEWMKVAQ